MKRRIVYGAAALVAGAVFGASGKAAAQTATPCPTNAVYVGGSTAALPAFQAIANTLGSAATIVYLQPASCTGVDDIVNGGKDSTKPAVLDPTSKTAVTCSLAAGVPLDIGVSDVAPATCSANLGVGALTSSQKDFFGPVQAMTIAVPKNSTESSISAEAAYMVFGFDAASGKTVSPWTDPNTIFVRTNTSGTLNMIGTAIGVPANKWINAAPATPTPVQQEGGTGAMVTALATATNANTAIGILAAQSIQAASPPPAIKILAYQHKGQSCGYLPDSDSSHLDKINVRQGRYAIWGPVHVITNVDSAGNPVDHTGAANAMLTTIMNQIISTGPNAVAATSSDAGAGLTTTQKQAIIDAEAKAGVVPWCAMQVTRTDEVGAEACYAPAEPCGCHFESVTGQTVSSYCKACTGDSDCSSTTSTPKCRYGYCEAQ
jgi:hypothetical protein